MASFYELLPPAQFQKQHPDWYFGGQVAMMNPGMRAAMAEAVVRRLKTLPEYRLVWFAITDMDWGWDMDPASRDFAASHGGVASAPRLDMMLDIANRVREQLPGARLAFNAYHWSFTPPTGMEVPDYILVYPMTIQVDYRTALDEETNAVLGQDLKAWNDIASHVLVWDHITNFAGYIQPNPNIRAIGRSIRWLATLGHVQGYFAEGTWETSGGEFSALRAWLIARLLWDPNQDIDGLIRDFCDHFYGPAGPLIVQYIDLEEAKVAKSRDRLTEKHQVNDRMFDLAFVQQADAVFDRAEQLTAGTPYQERIAGARIPVDYVVLSRLNEYVAEAAADGSRWQPDVDRRRDRFWKSISAAGVKAFYQGGSVAELRQRLAIVRTRPVAPPELASEPASAWHDTQDLGLTLYGDASLVADPLASDHAAVRMNPKSGGWLVQMHFDSLPEEGMWRLFASVRVDGKDGAEPAAALRIGSAPPMGCFVTVLSRTAGDRSYALVEVPGGPFHYDTDHSRSVYFQSTQSSAVGDILIDRIIAVRDSVALGSGGLKPVACQ
jgi:hypothetical protein